MKFINFIVNLTMIEIVYGDKLTTFFNDFILRFCGLKGGQFRSFCVS